MTEKVTKLAISSRVILLTLQLLTNLILSDHKPDVFRAPILHNNNETRVTNWLDKTVQTCLGGLRHWDGEYFLHIAEHGYTYENTLAFYPLYPVTINILASSCDYLPLHLSARSWTLLVGVLINIYCFCKAANVLYALTQRIFNDSNKSWNAALLFCFNPASMFFTATYSESLFCWLTLEVMLGYATRTRFGLATIILGLSIVTRSNGFINMGFLVYFMLRDCIVYSKSYVWTVVKIFIHGITALIPLTFFFCYAYQQFCTSHKISRYPQEIVDYAHERNYVLAGTRLPNESPWCDQSIPYPYSYVQSHYWKVGFLRYYEIKQLPNFMLALPILSFLCYHCYVYLKHLCKILLPKYSLLYIVKEYKSLPFVLEALFLSCFCLFFVHIQVSTRLLCSSTPCIYWFAADYMPKTFDQIRFRSKIGLIVQWFGIYYVLGAILFSNNFPWT
ncbi:GPI mannosyltransferase 2-like [Teleopsis dalmanni]|uniref:GPI mannosyltransferase 2-like n=1 Tax=Teleopsis dalmanni TaxID=139649 RepID=UPI0018CFC00A|nr:GPI mannosyltransferase 2-like [Teleopsis dalmanni]